MSQEAGYKDKTLAEMGQAIRARRESLGLSVENVRDKTFIRSKYLLAIEAGDDSQIPGTAYFKGFLKSYANALGLDGFEYSRAYQEALDRQKRPGKNAGEPQKYELDERSRPPVKTTAPLTSSSREASIRRTRARRQRKKRPAFFLFLLLFIVAAGAYYVAARTGFFRNEPVEPPPVESDQEIEPGEEPPEETGELPEPPRILRTDPNKETTVWSIDAGELILILSVVDREGSDCWVRVTCDEELVAEETMGRGEARQVSGCREISIRAGRPWVLELNLNGVDLGLGGDFGPVKDLIVRVAR